MKYSYMSLSEAGSYYTILFQDSVLAKHTGNGTY